VGASARLHHHWSNLTILSPDRPHSSSFLQALHSRQWWFSVSIPYDHDEYSSAWSLQTPASNAPQCPRSDGGRRSLPVVRTPTSAKRNKGLRVELEAATADSSRKQDSSPSSLLGRSNEPIPSPKATKHRAHVIPRFEENDDGSSTSTSPTSPYKGQGGGRSAALQSPFCLSASPPHAPEHRSKARNKLEKRETTTPVGLDGGRIVPGAGQLRETVGDSKAPNSRFTTSPASPLIAAGSSGWITVGKTVKGQSSPKASLVNDTAARKKPEKK